MSTNDKVRVAVIGVGNCASSLVQGVEYYGDDPDKPGLMTREIAGLLPGDIEFSAAFDVSDQKVGRDLSEAIFAGTNNTRTFAEVPYKDVTVIAGPLLDGVGESLSTAVRSVPAAVGAKRIVEHLRATKTEVLVNYLPVGSQEATEFYANCALEARCAFVNAIPVFISRDAEWQARFKEASLPIIGDDIKSQVGATIVHRMLAQVLSDRGIELLRTYQLNVGGNTDFLNMKDSERLTSKKLSKAGAVNAVANRGRGLAPRDVHIGPSDYIPWLTDRKVALIRLECEAFGGSPLEIDMRMDVWDSPNSAGVVIDAVRYAAYALRTGDPTYTAPASAYLMKSPPYEIAEDDALEQLAPIRT